MCLQLGRVPATNLFSEKANSVLTLIPLQLVMHAMCACIPIHTPLFPKYELVEPIISVWALVIYTYMYIVDASYTQCTLVIPIEEEEKLCAP